MSPVSGVSVTRDPGPGGRLRRVTGPARRWSPASEVPWWLPFQGRIPIGPAGLSAPRQRVRGTNQHGVNLSLCAMQMPSPATQED